jgi:tetratricopeptide (TPR) repeat protein
VNGNSATVSAAAKLEAQQLTGRAQAASIEGDNSTATSLYQKAAQLNPSDPSIAYALGREYEVTRDARAMGEYCRFLALSPAAPEAADVRQRIAELALALPPDTAIVRIPVGAPESMSSPGDALLGGVFIPGLGQFVTHRPIAGFLVLAASAGAAAYGLQSSTVEVGVTQTAIDPLGHSYQYVTHETRSARPNLAVGVGAAAAISLFAALEAFNHAKTVNRQESEQRANSNVPRSVVPLVSFGAGSVGLGLSLR